jgi:hypothetical protein
LELANAARTSACGSNRNAGWPGKRGSPSPDRFAAPVFTPRIASVALYRWWQRACEPPIWQAPAPCDRMRQHCCHIAAAWSAAGVLADGNGRRAGRSRASRAAAGAIRRLPRCAAPRAPIGTQHAWLPLTAVARHCAGRPASGGDDRALRQRPRGASKFRNDRSERRQHSAHMAPHVDPCTAHVQRNATLGGSWRKLWLYGKGPRARCVV